MALIDLSLTICPNNSEPVPVEIKYVSHADGADLLGKSFGITHEDFPDKIGLSLEYISLTTHTGTHIDAPLHYGPISAGNPSQSIVDVPLEWFMCDGVVLRLNPDVALGDVTVEECQHYLNGLSYTLKPFDIILLHLQGDRHWGKPEYFTNFRGVSRELTHWLIDQGIKVIGVDTFGFDAPFNVMLKRYKDSHDQSVLWPAHFVGREKSYCQIERLTNLAAIPVDYGFKVICFPIKIASGGAGWSRVVASV